jgi:hypothetical protein
VVTNATDTPVANQLTLRQAINQIDTGGQTGTITFANNITTVNLDPTQSALSLATANTNITINGGANGVTIQENPTAQQSSELFIAAANTSLTLKNLTLTGGSCNTGGAVYSAGNLTISDSTISNCVSTGAGGGVAFGGGTLTLTSTQFLADTAASFGGALSISGTAGATITDCTFSCCSAEYGGAIAVFSLAAANAPVVTISSGTVDGSAATVFGGGLFVDNGTVTLAGGLTINSNSCTNPNPNQQNGGGIYFGAGTLTFNNVTVSNNTASQGNGMYQVNAGTTVNGAQTVVWIADGPAMGP